MFRHDTDKNSTAEKTDTPLAPEQKAPETPAPKPPVSEALASEHSRVIELLEKNLKWSQIIYEQNRKINHKLIWAAAASWLRFAIVAVPIILALWFLPPVIRTLEQRYEQLVNPASVVSTTTVNELINLLPISSDNKDQLKSHLK